MQAQAYQVYIPFEIGDVIRKVGETEQYELVDILHTYSANERTIVNIEFIIYNKERGKVKVPFENDVYEIVKENNE